MDLGLKDKVAIISGGSRGMGKAIAKLLVDEGCSVALIARDKNILEKTASEIDPDGKRVLPIAWDLSKTSGIPDIVAAVKKKFKTVHLLLNNAGGPRPGALGDVSDQDWQQTLDQNLKSAIVMTREVLPVMKSQKFGRIVNITSQYVKEPAPGMILSNTARAGVLAFSKSISHEIAPFNITINTLCPGPVLTDRMNFLIADRAKKQSMDPGEIKNEIQKSVPMNRIASPEEFANVAVFFLSERASFVTGTVLAVDGGVTKSIL